MNQTLSFCTPLLLLLEEFPVPGDNNGDKILPGFALYSLHGAVVQCCINAMFPYTFSALCDITGELTVLKEGTRADLGVVFKSKQDNCMLHCHFYSPTENLNISPLKSLDIIYVRILYIC